jgi:hypothetical protein
VLSAPNPSLQQACETHVEWVVNGMRLGLFDVDLCFAEPALVRTQDRKGMINPKQLIVPIGVGCDSEGRLEMVDGLLSFALETVYLRQ